MRYGTASWHRPYDGEGGLGFGQGDGSVTGEVEGAIVWVCVNEQAQGPPTIGAEPPERYRI
jgi:hypothetical protein